MIDPDAVRMAVLFVVGLAFVLVLVATIRDQRERKVEFKNARDAFLGQIEKYTFFGMDLSHGGDMNVEFEMTCRDGVWHFVSMKRTASIRPARAPGWLILDEASQMTPEMWKAASR